MKKIQNLSNCKAAYLQCEKRYLDWRAIFCNEVSKSFHQLWFCKEGEPISWASKDQQAQGAAA